MWHKISPVGGLNVAAMVQTILVVTELLAELHGQVSLTGDETATDSGEHFH